MPRKVISVSVYPESVKLLAELSVGTGLYKSQTVELALRVLKESLESRGKGGKHAS